MDYKALTYINLPLLDIKKAPGDTITEEEFTNGGQGPEDIKLLTLTGAISDNPNAPLNPDNNPPEPPPNNPNADVNVATDDVGKGVST